MTRHSIGIDFGTTKTLVFHKNETTGQVEAVRLGEENSQIPTTAFIDFQGNIHFGEDADDMLRRNEDGTHLPGFKMKLGSNEDLHGYFTPDGQYVALKAKKLVTKFLSYIRRKVMEEVFQNEPVLKATITRPVIFSRARCQELVEAAHDAGFQEVELTTEPEAAGLAFCRLNAAQAFKGKALIVDWGGGTLDIALVTRQGEKIQTHPELTEGDDTMGGNAFDARLWQYALMQTKVRLPDTQMYEVRRCKERLSRRDEVPMHLVHETGPCQPITLTRTVFNCMISADVDKAVEKIKALLARIPKEQQPEMLLLVGGSSQIPLIKEKLEAACKLPAFQWHHSRQAVAMGAALWGTKADQSDSIPPSQSAHQQTSQPDPRQKKVIPMPSQKDTRKATEESSTRLYEESMTHFYAARYAEAVEGLNRAVKEYNNLNAAWVLAQCYRDGRGVPVSYEDMEELAEYIIRQGSPIGYSFLAQGHADGTLGQNLKEAEEYRNRLLKGASKPLQGVNEEIRLLALDEITTDKQMTRRLAFEALNVSRNPDRFAVAAASLEPSEGAETREKIRNLLRDGRKANSVAASFATGLYTIADNRVFSGDPASGLTFIREAADSAAPEAAYLLYAAICENNETRAKEYLDEFWMVCNYGVSRLHSENRLPVFLKLNENMYGAQHIVTPAGQPNRSEITTYPLLEITNLSSIPLHGLQLSFHVDGKVQIRRNIAQTIAPQETLELLLDFAAPYQDDDIYIEVSNKRGVSAGIRLTSLFDRFFLLPPLDVDLSWKSGVFSGIVFTIAPKYNQVIENVTIRKQSNGSNAVIEKLEGPSDIGWLEFDDSSNLKIGERLLIYAPGYSCIDVTIANQVPLTDPAIQGNSLLLQAVNEDNLGDAWSILNKGVSRDIILQCLSAVRSDTMEKLLRKHL